MMRRKILLADDSPTIQRLVKQTFTDVNFEIVPVSNGEAAIKKFEEIRPHVVLADIYMPGKNGYEVCSYVRRHSSLGQTPVILLVGAFDAFDEETARQCGATANIKKPFEPTVLIELVTSVLLQDIPEPEPDESDLLGLASIFPEDAVQPQAAAGITEAEIERIADRVIQKLSTQVIENVAWDIVPDITEKIVREELKRIGGSGLAAARRNES